MYYSYVEIEYLATSFSPARMDLALKLLILNNIFKCSLSHTVLFCIAQSLLSLPLAHIGRGRR
jgi:hypothetical protein